ncbi:hypothetical protein Tco_0812999 [Tanacetum coccineum]
MVVLDSYPKHNMVAYLEKTDGNAEFHEIIDFLARSSIHNALTDSGWESWRLQISHMIQQLKAQNQESFKKRKPTCYCHTIKDSVKKCLLKAKFGGKVSTDKEDVSLPTASRRYDDQKIKEDMISNTFQQPLLQSIFGDDKIFAQIKGKKGKLKRKMKSDTESEGPGNKRWKNKTFEEIQALYEKVKRFDKSFTAVGSTEDERNITEMNEGASDPDKKKKFVKEDVLTKVPAKPDVAEHGTKKRKGGHMKMLARKRKRLQSDVDSDDEHRKCLKIVTFEGTIDSEIMERKSVITRLNKVSSPDGDYLVIYKANGNFRAFNYLLEVLHIFDRQDLFHLYELVMKQYSEVIMEGIEFILWGDLKIMMESSKEENDQSDLWNNQQN